MAAEATNAVTIRHAEEEPRPAAPGAWTIRGDSSRSDLEWAERSFGRDSVCSFLPGATLLDGREEVDAASRLARIVEGSHARAAKADQVTVQSGGAEVVLTIVDGIEV